MFDAVRWGRDGFRPPGKVQIPLQKNHNVDRAVAPNMSAVTLRASSDELTIES
jgi:hypothetical protein